MKNMAGNDEKKQEIVKGISDKMKKIWNTQKLIQNILDKKKNYITFIYNKKIF